MNGRIVLRMLFALVLIAGAVGVGVYVYNAGVAQGLAASGKLALPDGGVAPYPYYVPFYRPWGFGFGILGLIFPLFGILLIFALLRGVFFGGWRGRWGHAAHHEHWEKGVPPMFEEWHRRAHEPQSGEK